MADKDDRWNELDLAYVHERMSFVPRTERNKFDVQFRTAEMADAFQLKAVAKHAGWRVSDRTWKKYLVGVGWTVRLVLRSKNAIVAVTVGEHLGVNPESRLKHFWVHPDYHTNYVPVRLLQLARLELPERPMLARIPAADKQMGALMTALGWVNTTDDLHAKPGPRTHEYRIAAVARREYHAALAKGRAVRETPRPDQ